MTKRLIGTMKAIISGNKTTVDMKKAYVFFLALSLLAFVSGCVKDQRIDGLKLVAEGSRNGDSKMVINGDYSEWAAGDEVRINGTTTTVQLIDGAAYASSGSFEAPFYGIYPASIYRNAAGTSYTVNIPGTYTYATSDGKQVLQSPMAGYAESGNYVYFRHLTSAVTVQITNYYGFAVIVDSVIVISNSYKLHGDVSFTLGDDISIPATAKAGGDTVVMLGGGLQVVSGNSVDVQVPVLPQGSGNLFTLQVKVHKYNNTDVKRRFDSTQPSSHPLARNQIGYAPMTVGFPFTISATKRVIISQGNLRYQASTNTWQFAENQYDYIGKNVGNTTAEASRSGQSDWIDLFGWGTSGWSNGNTSYMPYANSTTVSTYQSQSLIGDAANADWGVYNKILNGGNIKGKWRTMTNGSGKEIDYLFKTRATVTTNLPEGSNKESARYVKARVGTGVENVKGIIIFPDNYNHPADVDITRGASPSTTYNGPLTYYDGFTVDAAGWKKMESEGCVFLPAAGYRTNVLVNNAGTDAYYWSSSVNATQAYALKYIDGGYSYSYTSIARNYGCAVRLVQDIE